MPDEPRLPLADQRPRPEPELKLTRTGTSPPRSSAREDLPLPRALVIADLARLSAGERAVAARVAGVPDRTVQGLAAGGLVLTVAEADSLERAQALAAELGARVSGLEAVDTRALTPRWAWGVLGLGLAASVVLCAGGALFSPVWLLLPVLWVVVMGVAVAGLWRGHDRKRRIEQGWREVHEAQRLGSPRAQALHAQARSVLAKIGASELPDVARSDLERALHGLFGDLDTLAAAGAGDEATWATLEASLRAVEQQLQTPAPALAERAAALERTAQAVDALRSAEQELESDPASAEGRAKARLAAARARGTERG